jgi:serine/threonine protein kinase
LRLDLEYVGPDLSTFIDKMGMLTLSKDQQHQVWIDASNGLEYLGTQNLIHLDIKPQNILLGLGDRAKICDFGISVQTAELANHPGGTCHYVSGRRGPPANV